MQCKMEDFPEELLEYILSLTPRYKNLQVCKLVCKRWLRAVENVEARHEVHFQRSVVLGRLLWNSLPFAHSAPDCRHHRGLHREHSVLSIMSKTFSHSACMYENSMYVFGGFDATWTTFNDLWQLDLDTRTWVRPITMGCHPLPKACATMLCYKKSFILFGGCTLVPFCLQEQWKLFNELHVYSIESNKWTAINTLERPPPTSAHSASIHGNTMVIFGGARDDDSCFNDIWCLNLDLYCWHKQPTSNLKPHPRCDQSQIELGERHLLILGGRAGLNASTGINDAWLLKMEGACWTWEEITMHNTEWGPACFWYLQAYKVGNYVIVVGKNRRQATNRHPPKNTLSIFILDITNVFLDNCSASWIPLEHSNRPGPDDSIWYSLVKGKGELIVFGGLNTKLTALPSNSEMCDVTLYKDLHYINAPPYVI